MNGFRNMKIFLLGHLYIQAKGWHEFSKALKWSVINYYSIYVLLEYSNYLRIRTRYNIYVVYVMCICSFILQSHLMVILQLSEIISTVEAMEVTTSHLVTAHPDCSAICISMQRVQKIHFHKHLSWEKSSDTSQVYRTFLGSENGHVCSCFVWRSALKNCHVNVLLLCPVLLMSDLAGRWR